MAEAVTLQSGNAVNWTADATYTKGDVIQWTDGRAGIVGQDVTVGNLTSVFLPEPGEIYTIAKTASMVLLRGGKVYWDYSANKAYFRKINDQDFYVGRVAVDALSADTTVAVAFGVDPRYDIDAMLDPGLSVPVGTAAAGAFGRGVGWKGGGCLNLLLTATSEAQKIDWMSKDGWALGANAIVEFAFSVPTGTAAGGAQDLSLGIASATSATDADAIAKHCFIHVDGNSVNVLAQSKDGTTTVTATDTLVDLTAGATNATGVRVECWMDTRDPADVQIYLDGVLVLGSTVFSLTAVTTTPLYLLAHLEKTSSTDAAEVDVDFLRARFMNT